MGMTKNTQGLAISGAVQANLAAYQLNPTAATPMAVRRPAAPTAGVEPMEIGAVDLDEDIYELEYQDIISAINTQGFTGRCYKCQQVGHTIARCPKPAGYRAPGSYRGWTPCWRGGRGRGRTRVGFTGRDQQTGCYFSLNQVGEGIGENEPTDTDVANIEIVAVADDRAATEDAPPR